MNHRILPQILIVTIAAALSACSAPDDASKTAAADPGANAAAKSAAAPKAGAAAKFSYADGSPAPVTPWGDPDLQGTWPIMNLFATRLQRDPKYGTRRYLNDEEWKAAEEILKRRDERYQTEIKNHKLGMGHWAESTTRTDAARLTSLISYPPDGRIPGLTEHGKELQPLFKSDDTGKVFDSPLDFDAWDRCITRGLPSSMLPYNYNNGIQIFQSPGYVVVSLEMIHEARIIPIDRQPLDSNIKEWMGESRGHWEGSAFVVETTNFNGKAAMVITGIPGGQPSNTPTTPDMKITERFTRVSDERIDYEMTIEDPSVLTDKWTVSYPMFLDPKYTLYEYACNEDNTAIRNFIVTSRYERGLAPNGTPLKKKAR
jgi:hypothetical protein